MPFIKKIIPSWLLKFIRPVYHGVVAFLASIYFGSPSAKMFVIGVTGTAGKSTTAAMLSHILNFAEIKQPLPNPLLKRRGDTFKCGYMTTVNFFDGEKDFINKHGLSMPGGWRLQKQLRQILNNGCKYAIVECTSEGLLQNRHLGINFSGALFTNLSEAHIEAHGSFRAYKEAKGKLFGLINKSINHQIAKSFIGVNLDDPFADYFLEFDAARKFGVSFKNSISPKAHTSFQGKINETGFELNNQQFEIKLPGDFNRYNALLAVACANILGVTLKTSAEAVSKFIGIRGRMEPVENKLGIKIYVDYGCEPATIRAALKAANEIPHFRLIHVTGTTGGHRDTSKRFKFGKASAQQADITILTNDDVYDSDPNEIIINMETGFNSVPEEERKSKELIKILDRRLAIAKALALSKKDDLVLITGKGSEQFLVLPGNKRIEWDEVSVVREEISKLV
jgi:UDP-N-acetylmuramoyl-L-alanyl-D-glutamate--2,6-diaminopimelate ligase